MTKDAHDEIVSEQLWKAAQSKTSRVRNGKNKPGVAHGLLECSGCGGPLSVQSGSDTFYGCRRQSSAGPCPASVTGKQQPIDDYIDAWVESALDGGEGLDAVKAARDLDIAKETLDAAIYDEEQFILGTAGMKADAIRKGASMHEERRETAQAAYDEQLRNAQAAKELPRDGASYRRRPLAARQRVARELIERIVMEPFPKGGDKARSVPTDRLVIHPRV